MSTRLRGVLAPVLTPFHRNLDADVDAFIAHCRWLIDQHASLAIFGTNSEAASLAVDERIALTDAILAAGIPASRLMPGTGACSIRDAVTLTRHAVRNGAAGVLMLPPFYFKGISDDGLFAWYSDVIEEVGDERLAVYLYHIPQMTQVPITLALIERLLKRYPRVIAGAKDSSGDWSNSKAMIDAFATGGFDVFPASESLLSKSLAIGGAGCISATVNVNPAGIRAVYDGWNTAQGAGLHRAPMRSARCSGAADDSGDEARRRGIRAGADWHVCARRCGARRCGGRAARSSRRRLRHARLSVADGVQRAPRERSPGRRCITDCAP
jgi:4-hydroxy-tetrahydrodipicolinate synthase